MTKSTFMRTGSVAWLLRHELRLAWRQFGNSHRWVTGVVAGVVWAAAHVLAWLLLSRVRGFSMAPMFIVGVGAALWLITTLMLSQAIAQSVSVLFVRGDLDLLLSSPVSVRSVFTVRLLAVALQSALIYLLLLAPLAHVGVFTGRPELLAIYPALLALGLGVSAVAVLSTLALVRLLGARRARTVAQVLGAVVGAALFLFSQAGNLAGTEAKQRLALWLMQRAEAGGPLAPASPLWWPARAALGDGWPLLGLMVVGVGGFWAVATLARKRFLAGTQESVTGTALRQATAAPRVGSVRFRRGTWRNVLVKEWRLIRRDPQLISQTLLQTLYILPLMLTARHQTAMGIVIPGVVLVAGNLTSSLAWITVAAEDAPDLIGSAPLRLSTMRWVKAGAALLPVWLLVSPLALLLLVRDLSAAGIFMLCLCGATASVAASQVWYPRRGNRLDMKSRGRGSGLLTLLEMVCAIAWAGTAMLLLNAPLFAPLSAGAGLVLPAAAWWFGRSRRRDGVPA